MATGPKSNGEIPGYHSTKISSAESIDLKSASAVKAAASNEYFYQVKYGIQNFIGKFHYC